MKPKYDVACPKCGAGPDDDCRTLKTNRVTDTHLARIDQQALTRHVGSGLVSREI